MNKNSIIKIRITDIADDGSGIGRYENMVVFVRGMLPGEYGEVLIIKVTKSYAIGKIQKILEISPDRVNPPSCEGFSKGCGGCTFCHFSYDGQLKYKENRVIDCLERIGGFKHISSITKPIISSALTQHYRNKEIYQFGNDSQGNIICGFYAAASHRIIHISFDGCGLENETSRQIREFTVQYANNKKFSVYNEESGRGFLRALMIRTNSHNPAEAMVVLIVNGSNKDLELLKAYANALHKTLPFVVSVYVCYNTKRTNVALSGEFCLLYGKETILDFIGNFDGAPSFEISPTSFYQVNPKQTERLYNAVYDVFPKDVNQLGLIYDIYCGIGTIGIYLLSRLRNDNIISSNPNNVMLVGVEYVESAVENAKKNALSNGFGGTADFYQGDASFITPSILEKYGSPAVIILDPPRKGCDDSLIDTVLMAGAENIIYVSCNPATLARDMKRFCAEKYECVSVQPVDMFPQSGHVETVVLLTKLCSREHIDIGLDVENLNLTAAEEKATYHEIKD